MNSILEINQDSVSLELKLGNYHKDDQEYDFEIRGVYGRNIKRGLLSIYDLINPIYMEINELRNKILKEMSDNFKRQ